MSANRHGYLSMLFVVGLLVFQSSTLWATPSVAVGSCRPALPSYTTLAAAIAGAPDGGTILVCPGSYPEQLTIGKTVTINGISSGNSGEPAIVPPVAGLAWNATAYAVSSGFVYARALAAQIVVSPGATVNFNNITIDGTNNNVADCGPLVIGIYFPDSAGSVNRVAFRNQTANCYFNGFAGTMEYPQGDGVLVQSDNTFPANVSVLNSSFHNAGWMAVHADGAGATVAIKNNTAIGPGITYGNGILVESGANASSVSNNFESNYLLNGQPTGFWGILLNGCAGNTVLSSNVISNSAAGIVATCSGNSIISNKIFTSSGDGIQVCGSNNVVQNNIVNDSGGSGINLVQGCADQNNLVTGNIVNSACTGLLAGTDAISNTLSPNSLFNVKFLLLSGSSCS